MHADLCCMPEGTRSSSAETLKPVTTWPKNAQLIEDGLERTDEKSCLLRFDVQWNSTRQIMLQGFKVVESDECSEHLTNSCVCFKSIHFVLKGASLSWLG
eukprot:scaffold81127_cov15-Tisochrysis_lutea.AAC.2